MKLKDAYGVLVLEMPSLVLEIPALRRFEVNLRNFIVNHVISFGICIFVVLVDLINFRWP